MASYICIVCGENIDPGNLSSFSSGPGQYFHHSCESRHYKGERYIPKAEGFKYPNDVTRCSLCATEFTIGFRRYYISLRRMPENNTYHYHEICYKKVQIGNVASVAQPAEQVIRNDEVAGSTPVASSKGLSTNQKDLLKKIIELTGIVHGCEEDIKMYEANLQERKIRYDSSILADVENLAGVTKAREKHLESIATLESELRAAIIAAGPEDTESLERVKEEVEPKSDPPAEQIGRSE